MQYRRSPEVEEVAHELVEDHHSMLRNHGPRIVYVMTKPPKDPEAGKDYAVRKVSGVNAFLAQSKLPEEFGWDAGELAVIEVKEHYWQRLKAAQQAGLVDHLLSHLSYDLEKDSWTIEGPEFGEFPEVLKRHGFWKPGASMKNFAAVVSEQLSLLEPLDEGEGYSATSEDSTDAERSVNALGDAIEGLRPDPESGIESVTISAGGRSATLSGDRG
jgi:hypothetical protein